MKDTIMFLVILREYIMENITLEELEILKSIKESLKNLDEKELSETLDFMNKLKADKNTSNC